MKYRIAYNMERHFQHFSRTYNYGMKVEKIQSLYKMNYQLSTILLSLIGLYLTSQLSIIDPQGQADNFLGSVHPSPCATPLDNAKRDFHFDEES